MVRRYHTLAGQIKWVIGNRIIFCLALLTLAVLINSGYDFFNGLQQTKKTLDSQCKDLSEYILAQALISNTPAINAKLTSLNNQSKSAHLVWRPQKSIPKHSRIAWTWPYHWRYVYPVYDNDGNAYGEIRVSGSYFYDKSVLIELVTKFVLLLFFSILIFFLLKPLSKRIPQELFVTPIIDLLSLLKTRSKIKKSTSLPKEIEDIQKTIIELIEEIEKTSREAALGKIATQVAHDIRSPLLVLNKVLADLSVLPERQRIEARNAIRRVTDIANNLLTQYNQKEKTSKQDHAEHIEPIAILLQSIVSEKRIQFENLPVSIELEIEDNAYNAFINADIGIFKRVLSNIINNSIEATKGKEGEVTISLYKHSKKLYINIKDNGCGIPKDKLLSVLQEGASFGKNEGSGLGLSYAVSKIADWGGDYSLTSKLNEGTQFEIILPESKVATWFSDGIYIPEDSVIVILDDDNYIHEAWEARFSPELLKKHRLTIKQFYKPQEVIDFVQTLQNQRAIFLLDYELGKDQMSGLELAKKLGVNKSTTLVTSRYEDAELRKACQDADIKILPKLFADLTPLHMLSLADTVFIDDDEMVTNYWQLSAEAADKSIDVFNSASAFLRLLPLYAKDTCIYIDSSLGELKGEVIAKSFYKAGYKNIILATGHPKESFKPMPWIKDIISKVPPWD